MIPHDEIVVLLDAHRPEIAQVLVLWRNIGLGHNLPVNVHGALADFQKAAQLNPRSLAALQNQAHVLSKLGRNEEAKREGKIFADLKDDAGALSLANQFLRRHPEMSNESVYWHVHDLSRTPGE